MSRPEAAHPTKRRHLAIASALLTAASASIAAIPAKIAAVPATPAPAEDIRAAIASALEHGRRNDCAGALRALDPLVPKLEPGADRNAIQRLRLACLGSAGRADELGPVQRELAGTMPRDGLVRSFGVLIAAEEGRYAEAAEQLANLAEDDPQSLILISGNSWRGLAQKLNEQRLFAARDRAYVALARADWEPHDRPDMRDLLAQGAIDALLARSDSAEAEALLGRIAMPEILYAMATERRYEPLWPKVEARMGPQSGRAIDRFAADRLDDLTRNPDDPRVMRDAIRAFILLGRYTEAAEMAGRISVAEGMGEDAVASVRYHAQALAALGRRGEAIERMQAFAALDANKTPEAVSGMVALAELLDEDGQSDRALAVARKALADGGDSLSPWGAAWLHRTEACALGAAGRAADARRIGDALKAHASDNQAAAIEGLLCLGRRDEAAAIAIQTLATAEGASAIVDQFQPDEAIWAPAGSRLRALWTPLLARRDVKAAFERRARILPRALWPSREPRPIPRKRSPGASGPTA
jgi:tetratricopeptide (TPR) repeat protein